MATNSLSATLDKQVEYETLGGAHVRLTINMVKNYLVSGRKEYVTDQELVLFMKLCQSYRLDPFAREAYLIKFSLNEAASMVVAKGVFLKRARRAPDFDGHKAGVVILVDGEIKYRTGAMVIAEKGEKLVGGWAKVGVKEYSIPIEMTVSLGEYIGMKSDGTPNKTWAVKSGTMIRKVALVQALREAFPDELEGLYDRDELEAQGADMSELDELPDLVPEIAEPDEVPQLAEPTAEIPKARQVVKQPVKQAKQADEYDPFAN